MKLFNLDKLVLIYNIKILNPIQDKDSELGIKMIK